MIRIPENTDIIKKAWRCWTNLLLGVFAFGLTVGAPTLSAHDIDGSLFQFSSGDKPILSVSGQIASDVHLQFSYNNLSKLAHHQVTTTTVVTDGIIRFEGVLLRDLLNSVGATGKVVTALATNGYEIDIPIKDAYQYDVLIAWSANEVLLDPKNKGPLWIIYPRDHFKQLQDIRYDYRWVWQLEHLTIK